MSPRLEFGSTIGIIGGGQLGQMMALSAIQSGYKVAVLDPDPQCPCAVLAQPLIVAPYDDAQALARLTELSDVVTYEFENADSALIEGFGAYGKIPQGSLALTIAQHRLKEKQFAEFLKIPIPKTISIQSQDDLKALKEFPLVIKSCRFGYDGKHQYVVRDEQDLDALTLSFPGEYVAERFVPFDQEISVVCACFKDGISVYEPFENVHVNGILSTSLHPARLSPALTQKALEYTERIAQALDYVGVLAVEYFVVNETILFNEMAPRPHNSAHGTIEGCTFSQFDLHIACITGAPRIQPRRTSYTLMINILGQDLPSMIQKLDSLDPDEAHLHLYGKAQARHNRKMGHLTLCATTLRDLQKDERQLRRLL